MRRISKSASYDFKMVRLYREDIERIYEILLEDSSKVEIKTDEYEFDRLEELFDLKREYITNLEMRARYSMTLEFRDVYSTLYRSNDDAAIRGRTDKIKEILSNCTPWYLKILQPKVIILPLGIAVVISLFCAFFAKDNMALGVFFIFFEVVMLTVAFLPIFFIRKNSIIYLRYRVEPKWSTVPRGEMYMSGSSKFGFQGPVTAGIIGDDGHIENLNQTSNQIPVPLDLVTLAQQLSTLRVAARREATEAEHDEAVGAIASAESAAKKGDQPAALQHLARAGQWAFDIATKIGTSVAAEAIKKAMFPS